MDPVLKWAFLGVGVFAFLVAGLLLRRPFRLMRAGGRATGEVTDNTEEWHSGSKGAARKYFFPQVAFTTAKGERISFKSVSGGGKPVPVGSRVDVLYDPDNPSDTMVKAFAAIWVFPILTLLFGLPFLLVGISGFMK